MCTLRMKFFTQILRIDEKFLPVFLSFRKKKTMNMEKKKTHSIRLDHAHGSSLLQKLYRFAQPVTYTHTQTHTNIHKFCFISSEEIFSYDDALSNEKILLFLHTKFSCIGNQLWSTSSGWMLECSDTNRVILKILL